DEHNCEIKETWLNHACILINLPVVSSLGKGASLLFDRVFNAKCLPSQLF
ncbi:hypothetical protein EDD85DRAFT_776027, partial [Armillaria nabsnona]